VCMCMCMCVCVCVYVQVHRTIRVNLYGPLRLCQGFVPQMVKRGFGRVVNVVRVLHACSSHVVDGVHMSKSCLLCVCPAFSHQSSGAGQLKDMDGCHVSYRMSKSSLNTLTGVLNAELHGVNVLVNACCPGFVRTGTNAPRLSLREL
jgi:NAD(P)-dependent dehydrogenase (short-subunit alcohol dehydrogenase family)